MASHIVHADSIGTAIPLEIDSRSTERRDTILLAHGTRLMSDVLTCFVIRLAVAYRFIGQDPKEVERAQELIKEMQKSFDPAYEEWLSAEYKSKDRTS